MAPLPPCGPPRSPPPRLLLLLLLLVLSATLLGAQARAEPAAGNAVPAQSRPCVDCHAFEFMQRALQDLRKTAYSLDARGVGAGLGCPESPRQVWKPRKFSSVTNRCISGKGEHSEKQEEGDTLP